MRCPSIALAPLVFLACNTAAPAPAGPVATAAPKPVPAALARAAPAHFGAAISAPEVALADVARDPASYAGRAFTTRGTVSAVCQEMGCWMEIKDSGSGAHLRMHGHSFFVPKTASGRTARVEATLVPEGAAKACAGEECGSKNVALLQLDATGVELD